MTSSKIFGLILIFALAFAVIKAADPPCVAALRARMVDGECIEECGKGIMGMRGTGRCQCCPLPEDDGTTTYKCCYVLG